MRSTIEFDKVLTRKFMPAKIPGMLDAAIMGKKHMPDTFYQVSGTLMGTKKSGLSKSPRVLLSDEIINWNKRNLIPGPGAHKLEEKWTTKKVITCLNLKSERDDSSFLSEPIFRGRSGPNYHSPNFKLVEDKINVPKMCKVEGKSDVPSFMKSNFATAKISPVSYNTIESFQKTQLGKTHFSLAKGNRDYGGCIQKAVSSQKGKVAPGQYDLKSIEKAYDRITLGAGRGWK